MSIDTAIWIMAAMWCLWCVCTAVMVWLFITAKGDESND